MKAALFYGREDVRLEGVPMPEVLPGTALVRNRASGICGSDKGLWMAEGPKPGVHGHEAAGQVVEVGPGVRRVRPGDRVVVYAVVGCGACRWCAIGHYTFCQNRAGVVEGGYGEYVVVPERNLLPLPEDIPFEQGCLISDCLGTPATAIRYSGIQPGQYAVVFGCGPIGLNCIQVLKHMGVGVTAIDTIAYRLEAALALGAAQAIDASEGDVISRVCSRDGLRYGPDMVFECSGNPMAQKQALQLVQPGGTVVFVGENPKLDLNPSEELIRRSVTVKGSWYFTVPGFFRNIELVRNGVDPCRIVTHLLPFEEIACGFDLFCGRKERCLKVVLTFGE